MNAEWLAILRCPRCRGELDARGEPPELRCRHCAATFALTRGIPRLAGEPYVASFGRQWNRYDVARDEEDEAVFGSRRGSTRATCGGSSCSTPAAVAGVMRGWQGGTGHRVVGVDLSAAVEKAAALCAGLPEVAIVQADLLDLPLAEAAFDVVFSIGVLHHSPDPRRALRAGGRASQAGRPAGGLALPQEHPAPGGHQLDPAGRDHPAPRPGARAALRGARRARRHSGAEPDA